MRLFIDCEFNDFQGELISMALVAEDGREWYKVVPCLCPGPWAQEHVMPILERLAVPVPMMQADLQVWLAMFDSIHVVADWPEDIKHFCDALITGPGMRIITPPLTMEVQRIDTASTLPHNALHDARALRDAVCSKEQLLSRSQKG